MTLNSTSAFVGAAKQYASWVKTATRTSIAGTWFSVFDIAGKPGAGTLAGSSTTAGVVPTDATAGFPSITDFAGGATGYLAQVEFGSNVACRMKMLDCLWKGGAYTFNANVTLSSQPSYSARMPGGSYTDTQIWIEAVTAFTGNLSVAVTYTNQDGTTARTTGTVATGVAPTLGRMIQLPLQAGDTGVQKIETVVATVSSVGTFNVLVLRPLWGGRVRTANDGDTHGLTETMVPEVFADSALFVAIAADSTSTGVPEIEMVIASG